MKHACILWRELSDILYSLNSSDYPIEILYLDGSKCRRFQLGSLLDIPRFTLAWITTSHYLES